MSNATHTLAATLTAICLLTVASNAAITGNLVINGDAETGDMTGWTTSNGLENFNDPGTAERGTNNLAPGTDVGDHSFAGLFGESFSSASQSIDLSPFAADIGAGTQLYHISVLLQSRFGLGANDTATAIFTFKDIGGSVLASPITFTDPPAGEPYPWGFYSSTALIPSTAQTLDIEIRSERTAFSSTDAYIDNVHFALIPEPSSLLLLAGFGLLSPAFKRSRR